MSLREELQAAALINKQHHKQDREKRRPKTQTKETSEP